MILTRRTLLAALAIGTLAPSTFAAAPPGRFIRVGKLTSGEPPRWSMINDAIEQALADLGYVEGKNLQLIKRTATYPDHRMAEYAREMVDANVDVMVTSCMWTTSLAMRATSSIPIIIGGVHDPVGKGFIKNMARPTGNVTGFTANVPQLGPKMLEFLRLAVPDAKRVGIFVNPKGRFFDARWAEAMQAAKDLRIELEQIDMHRLTNVDTTRRIFQEHGLQAATFLADDDLFFSYLDRIIPVADSMRIPVLFTKRDFVDLDGLMSYGPNYVVLMKNVADYVDRLANGAKTADLPVAQPVSLEFAVNLKKAAKLGVTIPRAALLRADYLVK